MSLRDRSERGATAIEVALILGLIVMVVMGAMRLMGARSSVGLDRTGTAIDEADVERLLADKGIVRHRGKITSTINNARRAQEMRDEFGSLARFFWSYEPKPRDRPPEVTYETLVANPKTEMSARLSKELKKRGWTFVGPTTVYAFCQAMGLVNDHIEGCVCRPLVKLERRQFRRP